MARYPRLLGLSFAVLALMATTSIAQTPPLPPGGGPGTRARGFMAGMNLTDAQREQIRSLRQQHRTATQTQRQQLRDAGRALRSETLGEAPDQGKIESLQQQVGTLSQQLQAQRLELQQQIARILTPEQRRSLRDHERQMRQFRGRRMGRGRW